MIALDNLDADTETIGVVSASHEAGRQLTEAENDRRDEALGRDLAGYRWHQVQGWYGRVDKPLLSMVNPFVVFNVARQTLVTLGAKYHQFHVIFGARRAGGADSAWRFELLEADNAAQVVGVRKLFANEHNERLYIEAGFPDDRGRFFLVPVEHEQRHP